MRASKHCSQIDEKASVNMEDTCSHLQHMTVSHDPHYESGFFNWPVFKCNKKYKSRHFITEIICKIRRH